MPALPFKTLRTLSRDELIAKYDEVQHHKDIDDTAILFELYHRDQELQTNLMLGYSESMLNQTKSMLRYTQRITWMTVIMTIFTIINVILYFTRAHN